MQLRGPVSIIGICAFLDQIHKYVMLHIVKIQEMKEPIVVTDFFNLVMVWNRGISFGMLGGYEYSNGIFIGLSSVIMIFLLVLIKKSNDVTESYLYSVIIGGALGNVIDRIFRGAVADFLDFHYIGYHWPAFNLADAFISCGAVFLVIYIFFKQVD